MSEPASPQHAAARVFAGGNIPVLLLMPGTKIPFPGTNGHKDATTDLAEIDRLFAEHSEANYGLDLDRAGYCAIDTDEALGEGNLALLEDMHGPLPETFTVRTPRGGRHFYFKGSLPFTASKLAAKIDTKGPGYVAGPDCVLDRRNDEAKAAATGKACGYKARSEPIACVVFRWRSSAVAELAALSRSRRTKDLFAAGPLFDEGRLLVGRNAGPVEGLVVSGISHHSPAVAADGHFTASR